MVVGLQATWSRLNLTNRLKVGKLLWYVCLTFAKHICTELYNISDTTWNNGVLWDHVYHYVVLIVSGTGIRTIYFRRSSRKLFP